MSILLTDNNILPFYRSFFPLFPKSFFHLFPKKFPFCQFYPQTTISYPSTDRFFHFFPKVLLQIVFFTFFKNISLFPKKFPFCKFYPQTTNNNTLPNNAILNTYFNLHLPTHPHTTIPSHTPNNATLKYCVNSHHIIQIPYNPHLALTG